MSTVFELPDQIDLPEADQSQPEDATTCDVLAESDSSQVENSESEDFVEDVAAEAISNQESDGATQEPVTVTTVSDSPQPSAVTTDWKFSAWYENEDLLEQIRDAEFDCRRAESRIESLKAEMKEAKGTYEKAVLTLRELCSEIDQRSKQPNQDRHDYRPPAVQCTVRREQQATPDPVRHEQHEQQSDAGIQEPAASSTRDSDQDDITWRSVPITELDLGSIKGLGQKKQEALIDLCPTIGALEDMRARVGRDAASLPELMPKGIGRAACDQLEELLLNWLAKRPVSIQELATSDDVASAVENLSHEDQVSQRAAELDDGKPNCLAHKQSDDTLWKGGYRSFEDGVSLWECPWTPGENQDEWIRGYLAARSVTLYEEAKGIESATESAKESDRPNWTSDELDEL